MQLDRGIKPFAVCMTGISGSGKTTLANALAKRLRDYGVAVEVIDGDETRELIGGLFGHSKNERLKMSRVNQTIGWYLLRNKINFFLAVVAPYEEMRAQFREFFGNSYIELYVKAAVGVCAERDVKGLYRLSREGKLENFNGSTDVFEEPAQSNIIIDTDKTSIDESCEIVIYYLRNNGFIE